MKSASSVFASIGTTIFETMSRLAQAHGAINLGQGFPEGLEPEELLEKLAYFAKAGPHQYPSMMGTTLLREAVANHENQHYATDAKPAEIMVTSGATEALAAAILGLIEPGDEVVVFEPCYDSYLPMIRRAGGIPKLVRLKPPFWELPRAETIAAFGPKTKMMILNTPTNPTGKVFDAEELSFLAQLLEKSDAIALCDEVYEHLVFDGGAHIPLMALPGMRSRCVKIGSAGKIFSLTGWKVGWVVAEPALLEPISRAHQYLTFTTPPALQNAVAWGLDQAQDSYMALAPTLAERRDRLAVGLKKAGLTPIPAAGSYFLSASFENLGFGDDDLAFCQWITEKAGVAAIPLSSFYPKPPLAPENGEQVQGTSYARFCFAKTDDAIDEAIDRLVRYFAG